MTTSTDGYRNTLRFTGMEFGKISGEALELLIDACPENLTNVNDEKQRPIHVACMSGEKSNEVLEFLTKRRAQALKMNDDRGDYPLHDLVRFRHDPCFLPQTMESYPKATRKLNNHDGTPPAHLRVGLPRQSNM
jgi:hypothetical protein